MESITFGLCSTRGVVAGSVCVEYTCICCVRVKMRIRLLIISASTKCGYHFYMSVSALYDYYLLSAYEAMTFWITI
jgi:hypothetical protein